MGSNTAEMPSTKEFETPVEQTMDLPPLAILRIGDKVDFVLSEVAVVVDKKEDRIYYRGRLLADVECQTKEKGAEDYEVTTFKAGEEVTVPGSGSMDYALGRIANKKSGEALNNKVIKWSALSGDRFIIERLKDDKLSKGDHKGKPVKSYKIEHAARKAAK